LYAYVAWLQRTCNHGTIKGYLAGLQFYLRQFGQVNWDHYVRMHRLLGGVKRTKGVNQRVKRPVTLPMLALWHARHPDPTSEQRCVHVAALFGVLGMLRRSNLVPGAVDGLARPRHLTRKDIVFDPTLYALKLTIRYSKTLQFQEKRHEIWIAGERGAVLDPVKIWLDYVALHPTLRPDQPAFVFGDPSGYTALGYKGLAAGVKQLCADLGLDPRDYATHSLRRGGASAALASGLAPYFTMYQGDWASDSYLKYYEVRTQDKIRITRMMVSMLARSLNG
jgi:hypothetical protein